jgi:hypothetical protein
VVQEARLRFPANGLIPFHDAEGDKIRVLRGAYGMEILGWSSMAMLQRYLGKIPIAQLKRYPTTLERVFGRAV